jgi:uncharacterized membrane protein
MLKILIRWVGLPALTACAIAGFGYGNWVPMAILVMVVIAAVTVFDRATHPQRNDTSSWTRLN